MPLSLFTSRALTSVFTRSTLSVAFALLALCPALAACSDSSHATHGDPSASTDDPAQPTGDVSCIDDARVENMGTTPEVIQKAGDLDILEFSLVSTEPFPPVKGDNTFRIEIRDEQGAVLSDGLLVEATMPDHGHGTREAPVVSYDPDSEEYVVTSLNFFMPGVWRVELQCPNPDSSGVLDSAHFFFCIEG